MSKEVVSGAVKLSWSYCFEFKTCLLEPRALDNLHSKFCALVVTFICVRLIPKRDYRMLFTFKMIVAGIMAKLMAIKLIILLKWLIYSTSIITKKMLCPQVMSQLH